MRSLKPKMSVPRKIFRYLNLSLVGLLTACAQKPTKTFTSYDVDVLFLEKATRAPLQVTNETVIVDTRSHFDYALAHAPRSVHLNWTFFTEKTSSSDGGLKKNLNEEIRRLALMGLSPKAPIIVVGSGPKGQGDDGRLAWTLLYLGFENVQTAEMDSLGLRFTNVESPQVPNAPTWPLDVRESILADRKEVLAAASSKHDGSVHIIDVRSKDEYFSKNQKLQYEVPNLRAMHIEWKNFFTSTGRPNLVMKKKLAEINIKESDRILVISNRGVRSGAVTYALLALGYKKAANFIGGYQELMGRRR